MSCEKYSKWVSSYIDGALQEQDLIAFEDHMSHCNPCLEEVHILRDIVSSLKKLEMIEPPAGFHQDLMGKIQGQKVISLPVVKKKWYTNLKMVSALAAVFIFSVILINPLKINSPKESLSEMNDHMIESRMMDDPREEIADISPASLLEEAGEESAEIWTIETTDYEEYKESIIKLSQEMGLEVNIQDASIEITLGKDQKTDFQAKITQGDETVDMMIQEQVISEGQDQEQIKIVILINQIN